MFNRRHLLAGAGAILIASPAVLRAQTKVQRIVVVANRNHEADGLMAALSNQMRQNQYLSRPYRLTTTKDAVYPPFPQNGTEPRCLVDIRKEKADTTAIATMEIWCIDDLVDAKGDSGIKVTGMGAIVRHGPAPDGVIAFGTAGYPGLASNDGCATIGGTIFIHDAANDVPGNPGGKWAWQGKMEKLIPSKTPASFFTGVSGNSLMLNNISLEMMVPQNRPASVLQLMIAPDGVGISSVNIPYVPGSSAGDTFCAIDTKAVGLARTAGAANITSVETTHGVIRSMWEKEDPPFIYVTAIPNRLCHFSDEASSIYAQEFPSSHNAGVALKYVIPEFAKAISS
jgi:hypothetical protein